MIRTQRWTPDTCANPATGDVCVWLQTWDDEVPLEARTHDFSVRERACSFHAGETAANGHARCMSENRRKNTSFAILQTIKAIPFEQFKWSYSADGVLTLDLGNNLTTQQKNQLRSVADIQFGPGKVQVL